MTPRHSAILLSFGLLAACASSPRPSGKLEGVVEAEAMITAIDLPQRLLTLKGEDGIAVVVAATPEVKNLDQIKVGDRVEVSYTESISWQVKDAGEGKTGASTAATLDIARPGEKPAGTAGRSVSLTTTITAIDMTRGSVTLTGPTGKSLRVRPRDQSNLQKVKVGDLVDITYKQALAIAVRPVGKE